ncbi:MAG TPA: MerR family transcriptional regulator [Archangium sp.]|jgi:DNA-binding transcriptional MerR regulator|nr:MerR family transcriptional regulator [Archangium sp.]
MGLKVSEVARLAGVSVRTLHHYDEIGLLRPSERSQAGYRLYADKDLRKLQQVLFFKELGFPLEEIQRIVNDRAFDLKAGLLMQRKLLTEKSVRLKALIQAVDAALESLERGTAMSKEEMFEVFGDFDPSKYEDEVQQRWGDTDAYRESKKRTARYQKQDWQKIKAEGDAITQKLAALLGAGVKASDARAMDVAEEHRLYISRWFYPCPPEMHRGLGEMYVADSRFTENLDKVKPGLAKYWRDANVANADRKAS